jgi:hypothetical protein
MRRYRSFRLEILLPDGELPVLQLPPKATEPSASSSGVVNASSPNH